MAIWLLEPLDNLPETEALNPWCPWYNKTFGLVVRAADENEARRLADELDGPIRPQHLPSISDDMAHPWLHPKWSTCVQILPDGDSEVILTDVWSA
jgi:hypothetical protein